MSSSVIEAGSVGDSSAAASGQPAAKGTGRPIDLLTTREREILLQIARGLSSAEVAQALGISVKTVEWHRVSMGEKLGVKRRGELVRIAVEEGVVPIRFRRKDEIRVEGDRVAG